MKSNSTKEVIDMTTPISTTKANTVSPTDIIASIQTELKNQTASWRVIAKQFAIAYEQFGSDSDAFKSILKATDIAYAKAMKLKDIASDVRLDDPAFDTVSAWTVLYQASKLNDEQLKTLKAEIAKPNLTNRKQIPTAAMIKKIANPETKPSDPYQTIFTIKVDRNALKGQLFDGDAYDAMLNLVAQIQDTVPYVRVDTKDAFENDSAMFFNDLSRTMKTITRERLNNKLKSYRDEMKAKYENGGDKLVHGSGGIFPAAGGIKPCHL
jgi:hypothetical protein